MLSGQMRMFHLIVSHLRSSSSREFSKSNNNAVHKPGFLRPAHQMAKEMEIKEQQLQAAHQSIQEKDREIEALKEKLRNLTATTQRYGGDPRFEPGPTVSTSQLTPSHKANRVHDTDLVASMQEASIIPRTLGNILDTDVGADFPFEVMEGPPSLDSGFGSTGLNDGEHGKYNGTIPLNNYQIAPWHLPDIPSNANLGVLFLDDNIYPPFIDWDELGMDSVTNMDCGGYD